MQDNERALPMGAQELAGLQVLPLQGASQPAGMQVQALRRTRAGWLARATLANSTPMSLPTSMSGQCVTPHLIHEAHVRPMSGAASSKSFTELQNVV